MAIWDILPERFNKIVDRRGEDVTIKEIDLTAIDMDSTYGSPNETFDAHITESDHRVIIQQDRYAERQGDFGEDTGNRFIMYAKADCPIKETREKEYRVVRSIATASGEYEIISVTDYRATNTLDDADLIYKKAEIVRRFE